MRSSLGWEKSRVSHLLTRMESRGFAKRTEGGASGRRTGIGLTPKGRRLAEQSVTAHGRTVRRHFLDLLSPEEVAAIRAWSERVIERVSPQKAERPD